MSKTYAACGNCHSVNRIDVEKVKDGICGKCKSSITFHGLVSDAGAAAMKKIIRVSEKPVIVDFWASWCGPCQMYGPEFIKASTQNKDVVFLKVNTEAEPALSQELGIRGIPCTIIYKDGIEIKRQAGAMEASGVLALLKTV